MRCLRYSAMYFAGKSSPTTPTSFTGEKKLAATAAWLAEPPSRRGFSLAGVLMESSAVVPTMRTLILVFFLFNQFYFVALRRINERKGAARGTGGWAVGKFQAVPGEMF